MSFKCGLFRCGNTTQELTIIASINALTKNSPTCYNPDLDDLSENLRPGLKSTIEAIIAAKIPFYIAGPMKLSKAYLKSLGLSTVIYNAIKFIKPNEQGRCLPQVIHIAKRTRECPYVCYKTTTTGFNIPHQLTINNIDQHIEKVGYSLYSEDSRALYTLMLSVHIRPPASVIYNEHITQMQRQAQLHHRSKDRRAVLDSLQGSAVSIDPQIQPSAFGDTPPELYFAEQILRASRQHKHLYEICKEDIDNLFSSLKSKPDAFMSALDTYPDNIFSINFKLNKKNMYATYGKSTHTTLAIRSSIV